MLEKGLFDEYEACLQDEPSATTARCPVHIDVPEFCAEMAQGNFKKAYAVLQKRIPFAGAFCLVCDAPCEEACVRAPLDAPVRMGALERAAVRYGRTPFKKKFKTSKLSGKVAVVGGGISGLSAAFDLDRRGFAVTLFEQSNRLGGWLWELVGNGLDTRGTAAGDVTTGGITADDTTAGSTTAGGNSAGGNTAGGITAGSTTAGSTTADGIAANYITADDITEEMRAVSELAIELRYGQLIDTQRLQKLLDEYDAVFLGTGTWPDAITVDADTFRVGASKLFAGGTLVGTGDSIIAAVSSGKRAAITIERFVKKLSLTAEREREGVFETLLPKSLDYVESDAGVEGSAALYTPEEARQEAARCLQCECDECIKACVHMQRYGRRPKTYAREIYTNENVFLGTRYANKMINSCTLCGLCGQRCPIDLCMAPLIEQTRRSMVESEKMPPSAHDFALRDMAFSNGEQSFLVHQPPELEAKVDAKTDSRVVAPKLETDVVAGGEVPTPKDKDVPITGAKAPWMFFPGCQLAASEPGHVEAAYGWLRESLSEGVALFLGCCGAPADWAGRDDLLQDTLARTHEVWEAEGKPTLILACSSCKDVFKRHLPEIATTTLWQVLDEQGIPTDAVRSSGAPLNIHDACTSRHDGLAQESVRHIIDELGYARDELRYAEEDTKCCGYGGLVFYANREQEGDFAVDRAKESPHDLVVYCAMCKDLFIDAGKRTLHLLDLLFAEDLDAAAQRRMPSLSERQVNRAELKRRLLQEVWHEDAPAPPPQLPDYTITLHPEVLEIMNARLILVSDVEDALARAVAEPDERFYNTKEDCWLISIRKQYVTYWVKYKQTAQHLEVLSAYSHRMDILDWKQV